MKQFYRIVLSSAFIGWVRPTFRNCPITYQNSQKLFAEPGECSGTPSVSFSKVEIGWLLLERGWQSSIDRAFHQPELGIAAFESIQQLGPKPLAEELKMSKIKMLAGWRDSKSGITSQPQVWGDLQLSKDWKFLRFTQTEPMEISLWVGIWTFIWKPKKTDDYHSEWVYGNANGWTPENFFFFIFFWKILHQSS